MDIVDQIRDTKTLIFTVTPGRSGTKYLKALLSTVPGVSAHHEPAPNFLSVMRRAQQDSEIAFAFLRHEKLPAIAEVPEPVYVETSHLFCKGFLEPMILMDLRPKLIILRRYPSDVAWSLLERGTVPARTETGYMYLLDPRDPHVLPCPGWEHMTDYQLCFWYALEIERRQLRYADFAATLGLTCHEVLQRELGQPEVYAEMLRALELPMDPTIAAEHLVISSKHHNANARSMARPADIEEQEAEVWRAILAYEPLLPTALERIYLPTEAKAA